MAKRGGECPILSHMRERMGHPVSGLVAQRWFLGFGADGVQGSENGRREVEGGGGEVLAEVRGRGGSGNEEDVGGAVEEPGEGYLHGGGVEVAGYVVEGGGLERAEAAEGEERDEGDALMGEVVEEGVVYAVGEVVEVLDADDGGDGLGFGELLGGDVAKAEVLDEALLLQRGEGG